MRVPSHTTHLTRIGVFFLWFVRFLLTSYLYYQYLVSKTDSAPTKGGTLIEGVTRDVSFIPYTSFSAQDKFYQQLLFPGCLSINMSGGQTTYDADLCNVISNDYKTYVVSLQSATWVWSDGAPVSLDDVLYTYEEILQNNTWELPFGKQYEGITIQKLSQNSLSVSFPRSSKDNTNFFTHPILPVHIVRNMDRNTFTKRFAQSPITDGCATVNGSSDTKSLVFDLIDCRQSWLQFYQVKKTSASELQENPGIIDMTIGWEAIPGYTTGTLVTNDYLWLFFNMQQGKLNIYGRKNVIALLGTYVYLPENAVPLVKEHFLFDNVPTVFSDKTPIQQSVSGKLTTLPPILPSEITINADNQSFTYPLHESQWESHITFPWVKPIKAYTNYGIGIPLIKSRWSWSMVLQPGKNIFTGINRITFASEEGTKIGTTTLYYGVEQGINITDAIHIIYYAQDPLQNHIMTVLRNALTQEWLMQYFYIDGLPTASEFMRVLGAWQYDATMQTLALGVKKDISTMFLSDDPLQNPSKYVNQNLASQINDYFQSSLSAQYNIMPVIHKLYLTDLPFFLIGKRRENISLKPSLELPPQTQYDEATVRQYIFKNIIAVSKPQVTKKDILNRKKFFAFIWSELTN